MLKEQKVSLKSLVKRVELDKRLINKHPSQSKQLKRNIERQKEYIIQCVLENANNPLLDKIIMR